jgi:hypothetical protein
MPAAIGLVGAFISGAGAALGIGSAPLSLVGLAAGGAYSAGFAVGGFIASIGGIGTILSIAATGIGLLSQPGLPPAATPSSQTQIQRTAVGYRRKGYGKLRGGGHLVFQSVKQSTSLFSGESGNNMTMVVAVADGPVNAFTNYYIDGAEVAVDGSLDVTTDKYSGKVHFETRLGTDTQTAFSEMVSEFPTEVDSDWRGLGTALLFARFLCDRSVYNMIPNGIRTEISVVGEFAKLYDPRTDATAYSANAALVIRDQLVSGALENGHAIPSEFIDDDHPGYGFEAAADICDTDVAGPEATTRNQWELHGWNSYGEPPSATLARMFTSCDAQLVLTSNGKIGIAMGGWIEPTVTLTGDHIISLKRTEGSYQADEGTVIKSRYMSPPHGYIEQDAIEYQHANFATLGRKVKSLDFIMAANHGQCRHLQKIAAERINTPVSVEVRTNIYGLAILGDRYINIRYGSIDTSFEIVSDPQVTIDGEGVVTGVEFAAIAMTEAAVTYDETTEGVAPPEVQPDPDNDLTPDAPTLAVSVSGVTATCTLTDTSEANLHIIRYREALGGGSYGNYNYASLENGVLEVDLTLADAKTYEFQAKAVTPSGLESAYEPDTPIERTITLDTTPPAVCTSITAAAGAAGEIDVTFDTPSSANFNVANVYTNTANDAGTATLQATVAGANTSQALTITGLAADDYYVFVASANGSGVESTRTAATGNPVTVT